MELTYLTWTANWELALLDQFSSGTAVSEDDIIDPGYFNTHQGLRELKELGLKLDQCENYRSKDFLGLLAKVVVELALESPVLKLCDK